MSRYPFSPYPNGWFFALESRALPARGVVPLRYFGRDLVAYRSESGQAVVLDAHCPHLGAHLGYGGVVEGEGIRCPFHAWKFDLEGRCDDVPYDPGRKPPRVGVRCHPVHETSGLILLHHDAQGRLPEWHMPDLPEWGRPGWVGYEPFEWRARMHVQELAENIPDTAHFKYVHGAPLTPGAEVKIDGHVYRQRSLTVETGEAFTEQEAFGLGLVWVRIGGRITFLTCTTPIDEEWTMFRMLFLADAGQNAKGMSPEQLALVKALADSAARDVVIWEHKVYRDKPPLVAADGPIPQLRQWARQFYDA
jgi:phenylpropionate dioxygenase-like ring-hydroxylating dioxygenase large terminal subunit